MTTATITLLEYLRKLGMDQDKDFLQESVRMMRQMLMEMEVQQQTGATKHGGTAPRAYQSSSMSLPNHIRIVYWACPE